MNLSEIELNNDAIAVLKLVLKHELFIRPKENEKEDIYNQIVRQDLLTK